MRLTEHFTLEELIHSEIAMRRGLDNTPPADVAENLKSLAHGLEQVRGLLGCAMVISSGYRSAELNAAVGSSLTSAHRTGFAADFVAPAFGSPKDVAKAIRDSGIKFDQLIQEGAWVHISFDPRMRRDLLTAHFENGKATYSQGVA